MLLTINVNDVFTKVYEKIDGFQPQGAPLSAWVFRIAHNRLIDSVRRRPRQTPLTLDDAPEISSGPVFGGIDQDLALDQIKMGLAQLTPEQAAEGWCSFARRPGACRR